MSTESFYSEMVTRNLGFVTRAEQDQIRKARIFIPGVGGMGGAVFQCLVRSGVENFIIADIDTFEISNLNRQIFADHASLGKQKVEVAKDRALLINPNLKIEVLTAEWVKNIPAILQRVDFVVNGCDDVLATVQLMRQARVAGKTVIDAFASTLPSVYVIKPGDPRPEDFMDYPTVGISSENITQEMQKEASLNEMIYVLANSSTAKNVVMEFAAEMISGKRKRISLAPMVWMTGVLMSYEAIKLILGRQKSAPYRGIFYNPWSMAIERPCWYPVYLVKRFIIKNFFIKRLGRL